MKEFSIKPLSHIALAGVWTMMLINAASAQLPTPPAYNPIKAPPGWKIIKPVPPPKGRPAKPGDNYYWDGEKNAWVPIPKPPSGDNIPGSGDKGANRRLHTPGGYLGARGIFTEPSIDGGTSWVYAKDSQGNSTGRVVMNKHGVKPTMYFGLEGSGVIVDSGLQYEPVAQGALNGEFGWTLFQRVNNNLYSAGKPKKWEHWGPQVLIGHNFGTITLKLQVYPDGSVSTNASDSSTTGKVQPYWPTTTKWDAVQVRRVVGITQSFTIVDEAKMNGAAFSNGQIVKGWKSGNKIVVQQFGKANETLWTKGSGEFEYSPTAPNANPKDPGFKTMSHPWMIDFAETKFRRERNLNGDHPATNPAILAENRFYNETVNINLLKNPGNWLAKPKKLGKKK